MTTFVLVPGMSCGGWLWSSVTGRLRAIGHDAVVVTLPGFGYNDHDLEPTLEDAVRCITDAVETVMHGPVALVAHSGSGVAATGAAHALGPEYVEELIFYAAVAPERGVSMADEFGAPNVEPVPAHLPLIRSDMDITLMPDAPDAVRDVVFGLMLPTPGHYFYDRPTFAPAAELAMPARYLLGSEDAPFASAAERFAERLGVDIETVPGSHLGMITDPDAIADALLHRSTCDSPT